MRWTGPGAALVAELEIYRPGGEFSPQEPGFAEIVAQLDPKGANGWNRPG